MCGIAGASLATTHDRAAVMTSMLDAIRHRGPDDGGIWLDDTSGLSLGHRRLSILDLSSAGHQPMLSHRGRYVVVYNGEIYNHAQLRTQLGTSGDLPTNGWRGHSDTETLLAGFETWGIIKTLSRINGMFAMAIWDTQQKTLTLVRDRMGEKPLYFGWVAGRFAFASELKALYQLPNWRMIMEPKSIAEILLTGYTRGPYSAIQGIFRLPMGSQLTLRTSDFERPLDWSELECRIESYWSLSQVAERGLADPFRGNAHEASSHLEMLLNTAVSERMIADVPIGAFLSGGIDSSLIVALMQRKACRPVRTFSIGFSDPKHDEAPFARAVAECLGTEHTELYVEAADALAVIPQLPDIYDEPFADHSQIPTVLVSRLAKQHVTVALSGDGGDELFAGYGRYDAILRARKTFDWLPDSARHNVAAILCTASSPLRFFNGSLSSKIERFAKRLSFSDLNELHLQHLVSSGAFQTLRKGTIAVCDPPGLSNLISQDLLRRLMYAEQLDYLPNDILVKVDRAAMSASLETRIPFLDPAVVEFSWRLPKCFLHKPGRGKIILRDILARHISPELTERPKQGFGAPIDFWLRGPLRQWGEHLLSRESLSELEMVDVEAVRKLWRLHQLGQAEVGYALWNVMMVAAWRERVGANAG